MVSRDATGAASRASAATNAGYGCPQYVADVEGLKPRLDQSFKISRDPLFVEKLEYIVGLYLRPREHALVLCCDEQSQVQAQDRIQPELPLKKGRAGPMDP